MKVDKETLIRNRFWVILGVFLPLVLIVLIYLSTGVAGELSQEALKIKNVKAELDNKGRLTQGNTNSEMELLKTKAARLKDRRQELWKEAWGLQTGLYVWPKVVEEAALEEKNGGKPMVERKFGEQLPDGICEVYARKGKLGGYDPQYEALAQTFHEDLSKLQKDKGFDPVRFRDDDWKKVIPHVEEWKTRPPSYKEVWLAQEDYWVQRELFRALRKANESVCRFKKVKPGKDIDPNDPLQGSFENPYWHLDLKIAKKDQGFVLTGRISNPETGDDGLPRPKRILQIGQIYFWLFLDKEALDEDAPTKPVAVSIQGESLTPGKSMEIRETPVLVELAPQGIFGVQQVLERRTSPIKRIDQLLLGQQSHRTYKPLVDPVFMRDGMVMRPPPKTSGPPIPGKEAPRTDQTENGLLSQRYYNHQTEDTEVRRIPIGLNLVVDQAHMPEVEAALVSSRLRFQITQVSWQHFRGTLTATEDDKRPRPKIDQPPRPGEQQERPEEGPKDLVELTIYGIASLYDRPTDKKADPKDKGKGDKLPKGDAKKDKKP
jgi:hypothetical protein